MTRLAVVAHYDPRGLAAPHFLRQLEQLREVSDEVVVASPSELNDEAAEQIGDRARLLRRQNFGHDFGSWRDALEQYDWADGFDELILTNDSYVGYFRPLAQVIREMSGKPCEVWGMTKSWRHHEHVQSYFLYFTRPALTSRAFRRFWSDAAPATDRMAAIHDQEVGISRAMIAAGFALGSVFEPTADERLLANRRGVHWLRRRRRAFPARFDTLEDTYFRPPRRRDPQEADFLNWSSAFADAILDDGRLPVLKFDTLRYDPYWLGSERQLRGAERRYPALMAGVRAFLEDTASGYRQRAYENYGSARLTPLERLRVGYRASTARSDRKGAAHVARP